MSISGIIIFLKYISNSFLCYFYFAHVARCIIIQKIVLKVTIACEKCRSLVLTTVAKIEGASLSPQLLFMLLMIRILFMFFF
jgi:hypothetical protein